MTVKNPLVELAYTTRGLSMPTAVDHHGPIFLYDYGVILLSFGLRLKFLNFYLHNKNSNIEISV